MPAARLCYVSPVGFVGGAELSLLDLLTHLDRDRFHPEVVCLGEGPLVDHLTALGVPSRVWPMGQAVARLSLRGKRSGLGRLLPAIPGALGQVARLAAYLRKAGVRLAHTNGMKAHVIGGLAARLARVPVVWHVRDFLGQGRLEDLVFWLGARVPVRIITNSQAVARTWWERGVSPSRVVAVHNGVDVERYEGRDGDAFRVSLGIPAGVPLVGLIGMLAPWKGQMEFVEAARLVFRSAPQTRFVIVGEEPYLTDGHGGFAESLQRRVMELGLGHAVFLPGYRRDVPEVLAALDVVVHASTAPEPFGRVLVEAMAARRPLIAADCGAVREVVGDGDAAVLVPPGAIASLAEAMLALLKDPERRAALAEAGWARVRQQFTLEAHVRQIEQVYEEILGVSREPGTHATAWVAESREPKGEA